MKARLLAGARARREDFNYVLTRYGIERLLYRLCRSEFSSRFVLKGATLFAVWSNEPHRPTRDVDMLSYGPPDLGVLRATFQTICTTPVDDDGVAFDPGSVVATEIREDQEYGGARVKLHGFLGSARLHVQVDVGYGDAVTPAPQNIVLPTLLDLPAPTLVAYPRETVVAEKFEALVKLGMANSRMKDFFDLQVLGRGYVFEGATLADAVRATFGRRGTAIPAEPPVGLTDAFFNDPLKQAQWGAFLRRTGLSLAHPLPQVIEEVRAFTWPIVESIRDRRPPGRWTPHAGWT